MTPDVKPVKFQSAPPVKGATLIRKTMRSPSGVSIRAPREGGDSGILITRTSI